MTTHALDCALVVGGSEHQMVNASPAPTSFSSRDTWRLDELFVNIQGQRQYLSRAVDRDYQSSMGALPDIQLHSTSVMNQV